MGFLLLWIETLAAALLGTACVLAFSARCERAWCRWLPPALFALVPLGLGAAVAVGAHLLADHGVGGGWFSTATAWTAAFTLAAGLILSAGLRGAPPAANAWPGGRLALGFGIAFLLQVMTLSNLDAAARVQLAGLRSESGALALSVAPPRVPERANAALVYQRAFDALERIHPADPPLSEEGMVEAAKGNARPAAGKPPVPERFDPWLNGTGDAPAADDPELLETQDRLEPVLALVRRAAAMPECVFEHDYARPSLDWLLPELGALRRVARLLVFDACARALQGRTKEALESVTAIRSVARHMRADSPLLISWLCACAVENLASATLERVLASGSATAVDLAPLREDDGASYSRALVRALRMEEAFGLSAMAALAEGVDPSSLQEELGLAGGFAREVVLPLWRVFLLGDDVGSYRRVMLHGRELGLRPYHQSAAEWKSLEAWTAEHKGGILTRLLVPSLRSSAEHGAITDARLRLARLAAAAALHRAETGDWPARGEDLVPARIESIPVDPFDGRPLRLRPVEGGVVLYSVGPNGSDDGGESKSPDPQTGDLVFRLGKGVR